MRTTNRLAAAAAAVLLLTAAGCASDDEPGDEETTTAAADAPEMPEMPEPDLDGVPDVVAEVNGESVSRDEFVTAYEGQFQQAAMQAQMTGEDVDQDALKTQIADMLVDTELLAQEAVARDFTVSDEEVESTLEEMAEANQMESVDDLFAAFEQQGMDADEVRSQLSSQLQIEQLYEDEGGDFTPSEDELQELYDAAVAQQQQQPPAEGESAPEPPSFEEARPQLEQQAIQEHQAEAIEALLGELRESADITVNL